MSQSEQRIHRVLPEAPVAQHRVDGVAPVPVVDPELGEADVRDDPAPPRERAIVDIRSATVNPTRPAVT